MITKDWEWTMISLAQQIHRIQIIGDKDHQKMKKKNFERKREKQHFVCEKTMHRM